MLISIIFWVVALNLSKNVFHNQANVLPFKFTRLELKQNWIEKNFILFLPDFEERTTKNNIDKQKQVGKVVFSRLKLDFPSWLRSGFLLQSQIKHWNGFCDPAAPTL